MSNIDNNEKSFYNTPEIAQFVNNVYLLDRDVNCFSYNHLKKQINHSLPKGYTRFMEEIWRRASQGHSDHGNGVRWDRSGSRLRRSPTCRRVHDVQLLDASHRSGEGKQSLT